MRNKILLYNKLGVKIFKIDQSNFFNMDLSFEPNNVIFYLNLDGIVTINDIFLFSFLLLLL